MPAPSTEGIERTFALPSSGCLRRDIYGPDEAARAARVGPPLRVFARRKVKRDEHNRQHQTPRQPGAGRVDCERPDHGYNRTTVITAFPRVVVDP
jgi:hypothetical protein